MCLRQLILFAVCVQGYGYALGVVDCGTDTCSLKPDVNLSATCAGPTARRVSRIVLTFTVLIPDSAGVSSSSIAGRMSKSSIWNGMIIVASIMRIEMWGNVTDIISVSDAYITTIGPTATPTGLPTATPTVPTDSPISMEEEMSGAKYSAVRTPTVCLRCTV